MSGAGNPNYGGRYCTPEWRRNMSKAQTGKRLTEEHKKNIGDGVRGKIVHTEEFKENLRKRVSKPIYRDDGIKYNSITEAAIANGVTQSAISHSIRRNQKSAGHRWSYTEI